MAKVHPNRKGLLAVLKSSEAHKAVDELAEEMADYCRGAGIDVQGIPGDIALPVRVDSYETDRARAEVWLAHPAGLAIQAKHGLLTKAASSVGLEVKGDQ